MSLNQIAPVRTLALEEFALSEKTRRELQKREKITFFLDVFNEMTFFFDETKKYQGLRKKLFRQLYNGRLFHAKDLEPHELSSRRQRELFLDIQWLYRQLKSVSKELSEEKEKNLLFIKFPTVYEKPSFPDYFKALPVYSNVIYATPESIRVQLSNIDANTDYRTLVLLRAVCNDEGNLTSLATYLPEAKITHITLAMDGKSKVGDHELKPLFHRLFPIFEDIDSLNRIGIVCFQMNDDDAMVLANWIKTRPNYGCGYYCSIQEEYGVTSVGWQAIADALKHADEFQINLFYDCERPSTPFEPLIKAAENNQWITVKGIEF